jgi:hypothetical protein
LRLALFTTERQRVLRLMVALLETCLKYSPLQNEGNFLKLSQVYTSNLALLCLLIISLLLFSIIITLYSKFQAAMTP